MKRGFTLIELMIVVTIAGVLAGVAIPSFNKYIRRSKVTEAYLQLRKAYDGEIAYFTEEHTDSAGVVITKQFIATNVQPPWPPGKDKRTGNFETEDWQSLKFSPDSPLLYSYFVDAYPFASPYPSRPPDYDIIANPPTLPPDIAQAFQVSALGDIDGDGKISEFQRNAMTSLTNAEPRGQSVIFTLNELE